MVSTIMVVKDGELARRRAQHTADNKELVTMFANLAIEEEKEFVVVVFVIFPFIL